MSDPSGMQFLGEIDGKRCFWAEPGLFIKPGFYFWDGAKYVHVPPIDLNKLLGVIAPDDPLHPLSPKDQG